VSALNPDFSYASARLQQVLCQGECLVTAEDIARFRALMGYAATPPGQVATAPSSMGLTYGLRLGWEHRIFPPGAIRVGDDDRFGVPARAGDRLLTQFRIVEKFERKDRRFMKYEMHTANQRGEMVCSVSFTAVVP
jgi:acyl dehydratase